MLAFLALLSRCTHIPLGLLIVLTFGCGILSACFLNDTIALIFTSLSLSLTLSLGLNQIHFNKGKVGTVFEGKSQFNLTLEQALQKQGKF